MGYKCPECGGEATTIEGRDTAEYYRRRKECKSCKTRFTTYETIFKDEEKKSRGLGKGNYQSKDVQP